MKKKHTIFLFGEAERGDFCTPLVCHSLTQLADTFGNPPEETMGLLFAVQALLFERRLIYFRVAEEGYSMADYHKGIHLLKQQKLSQPLSAIGMPGVGDAEVLHTISLICKAQSSLLITSEKDLYDYLTT